MELWDSDLHRAVVLLRDAAEDPTGVYVPQALLDGLGELVPGMYTSWSELDYLAHKDLAFQASTGSGDLGDDPASFWEMYGDFAPCQYLYGGHAVRNDVVTWSDFSPDHVFFASRVYKEAFEPYGEKYVVYTPLPTAPGRTRVVIMARDDRDFTTSERDLLTLLQPHLLQAYRQHQRRRAGVPPLTTRQWDILRCLAAGQPTAEIAQTLFVTQATVRKHLENIYGRLGVTSRGAALARTCDIRPDDAMAGA